MNGAPEQIGRYVVEQELGSGGMGEVYLAFSPAGDPVAVKLIRPDRLDPVTRARFEKEALIARTVVGTNRVARFLDADPYAERPWLAMEYVPGQTLLTYVDGHGPLSAPLVASLGALLTEGLEAVHAVGLLHRDLKPQNVMLGAYGPILIDFGLGAFLDTTKDTLSHSGMIIGTVRCMPPEQALGRTKVKESADVYGLGTVLLYAATEHYPFDGARWEAIVGQVANPDQAPDLSGLPQPLVPLIGSMLAHDPADRPSLDAVMAGCTSVLASAGLSPMEARHALIDATATDETAPPPGNDPPVVWERLAEQAVALDEDASDSPLDSPSPAAPEPPHEEDASEAADVPDSSADSTAPPAPVVEVPAPVPVPRKPGRPPASLRVAEELRSRYAAQPGL
ncbi:serine/threonine-protein kinase [Streptomyces sp. AC512_CC834]|uniref:serine/threonine-protein kinase n=1 Tax=Streptomyces sp. AC512_CC834 TaxID=2823691 RepID=UPI001C2600BD|nr:serine/threonine-protein kinase [Streptomyces sp. AC512_CC834]